MSRSVVRGPGVVLTAALLGLGLTGCQQDGSAVSVGAGASSGSLPATTSEAAAPSETSATATSPASTSATPERAAGSSSGAGSPTSAPSSAPTSAAASPSTQGTSSSEPAGECSSSSSFVLKRGEVAAKPVGTAQRVKTSNGEVEVTVGEPQVDAGAGTDSFPGSGMETVIYPLQVKVLSGTYVSTYLAFGAADGQDRPCQRDAGTVISPSERVQIRILRSGDTLTAKAAYAVPAGVDLKTISVLYADEYARGDAQLAWNGS
ncbi:hypothetical protein ACMYYO_05965 [Dermacoccaceae bacterium W4C1]